MSHKRQGITLIELLVTLISASVVLAGLVSVIMQMANEQKHALSNRAQAFDRVRGLGEIAWTLKQVGRRGLRQARAGVGLVQDVDDPNLPLLPEPNSADSPVGVPISGIPGADYPFLIKRRGVITYVKDDFHQWENKPSEGPLAIPQRTDRSRTGVIFQHESVIYRFECRMDEVAAHGVPGFFAPPGGGLSSRSVSGFNRMNSGALLTFIENADKRALAEVLAVGVDRFEVDYREDQDPDGGGPRLKPVNPWGVRWEVVFFKNLSQLY